LDALDGVRADLVWVIEHIRNRADRHRGRHGHVFDAGFAGTAEVVHVVLRFLFDVAETL